MLFKGHVSFRGKSVIKDESVMRNGKIIVWAFAAGVSTGIFLDGKAAEEKL